MENLPVYTIHDARFFVDVKNDQLQEVANSDNVISFRDMTYEDDYYSLRYDTLKRRIPGPAASLDRRNDMITVRVPHLTKLDPQGMAKLYNLSPEQVKGKPDLEVMIDMRDLKKRIDGILPSIDIAGHKFFVDIRLGSLRPEGEHGHEMRFRDLDKTEEMSHFLIFYNTKTLDKESIKLKDITEVPKDIFLVLFPLPQNLDPVGYANKIGDPVNHFVRNHPIQKDLKAMVIPWEDKELSKILMQNRKDKLIKQITDGLPKKTIKKKKGKGL